MGKGKNKGMYLSLAQLRFAYHRLYGVRIHLGDKMHEQANEMYKEHGEAKIREVVADYVSEKYFNNEYPEI